MNPTPEESKEWFPIGMRVVISGGNLYALGRITGYGSEEGEPWATTDDGVAWSALDVTLRVPNADDLKRLEKP